MSAQQTFEELLHKEGKLNEYATLATMASMPGERVGILETLIGASKECRALVDSLLIAFQGMPGHFRPIVDCYEELRRQQLRREDAWAKIIHQFQRPAQGPKMLKRRGAGAPTDGAMQTALSMCQAVDAPLQGICDYLMGLAAASGIEALCRWFGGRHRPEPWVCEIKACTEFGEVVIEYAGHWRSLCLKHHLEAVEDPGRAARLFEQYDRAHPMPLGLTDTEVADLIRRGQPLPPGAQPEDVEGYEGTEARRLAAARAEAPAKISLTEALAQAAGVDPQDMREAAAEISASPFAYRGDLH